MATCCYRSGTAADRSALAPDHRKRVDELAVPPHAPVEVRAGGESGEPGVPDPIARLDGVPSPDRHGKDAAVEMRVHRNQSRLVRDHHDHGAVAHRPPEHTYAGGPRDGA